MTFAFPDFEMNESKGTISEDTTKTPLWLHVLLRVADAFWSCFLVFPLSVLYWSSTRMLLDATLGPETSWLSDVISLTIGTVSGLAG